MQPPTPALLPILFHGLTSGMLTPEDLDPDLAAIQVCVPFVEPCRLHPQGDCRSVAVHEFGVDATSCVYPDCDPEGPVPQTTDDVVAVHFLWSDGETEAIGAAQLPYLRPVLARLQGA